LAVLLTRRRWRTPASWDLPAAPEDVVEELVTERPDDQAALVLGDDVPVEVLALVGVVVLEGPTSVVRR
jgi:hypothetical protein